MSSMTLDGVEAFMFAYHELHLPGKVNAASAIYRLYREMKSKDLWLDNESLKSNKDAILSAIAMQVVSSSMMIIEDFVKICYSMMYDILKIPSVMVSYATIDSMLKDVDRNLITEGDQVFLRVFHYLDEADLKASAFAFLTQKDKEIIIRQHKQNAKSARHTYAYAVRVYETFRKPYNKHK